MKTHHWLQIRTGKYALTDQVHFDITGNDAGVVIALRDLDRGLSYWISVRDGRVDFGDITPMHAWSPSDQPEERTVLGRFNSEVGPEGHLPETGIKFTVMFPGTPLAPRLLRVLGGYQRREHVRVVYREVAAGIFMDRIARFSSPTEIALNLRRGPTCLLPSDWLTFGRVPYGGKFKLGRHQWEKLSLERLTSLLDSRTFNGGL